MNEVDVRIAFPTSGRVDIDDHFGHAKEFVFYSVKNGDVVSEEFLTPPPHAPGVIPKFIGEQKAAVLIAGGIGKNAINVLNKLGVEVVLGITGNLKENLEKYLKGSLVSDAAACERHHGHHDHHH